MVTVVGPEPDLDQVARAIVEMLAETAGAPGAHHVEGIGTGVTRRVGGDDVGGDDVGGAVRAVHARHRAIGMVGHIVDHPGHGLEPALQIGRGHGAGRSGGGGADGVVGFGEQKATGIVGEAPHLGGGAKEPGAGQTVFGVVGVLGGQALGLDDFVEPALEVVELDGGDLGLGHAPLSVGARAHPALAGHLADALVEQLHLVTRAFGGLVVVRARWQLS